MELLLAEQLIFPLEDCRSGLTRKPLVDIVYENREECPAL